MTMYFKNVYIDKSCSLLGRNEHGVSISADITIDNYYNNKRSVEEAESSFQDLCINRIINGDDIDLCISSDLQNQLVASNYAASNYKFPFLTSYSACASFVSNLIIASSFIQNGLSKVVVCVSSHNLVSEKQYRFPIEYGSIRKYVNTFTATGAVSTLVTNKKGVVKVESATIGKVCDIGYNDVNNFGAIMAHSTFSTIVKHLKDTNRSSDYYDLVLTGDLGVYGLNILKECLIDEGISFKSILDAGSLLFKDSGKSIAGGSGPICLPLILFNKIFKEDYKRILIVGSGSLHSKNSSSLMKSIPSISHAVSLEVIK